MGVQMETEDEYWGRIAAGVMSRIRCCDVARHPVPALTEEECIALSREWDRLNHRFGTLEQINKSANRMLNRQVVCNHCGEDVKLF